MERGTEKKCKVPPKTNSTEKGFAFGEPLFLLTGLWWDSF